MVNKVYEVYICKYDSEIVYIGQGARGRHKHCTSGCSHVFELNRLYFLGDTTLFEVVVRTVSSSDIAKELEKELIQKHKPRFNKVYLSTDRWERSNIRLLFKNTIFDRIENIRTTAHKKLLLRTSFKEFMEYHKHDMILQEGLKLRGHGIYKSAGLPKLASIISNLKVSKYSNKSSPYWFKLLLEESFNLHYDHEIKEVYHV